MTLTSIVLIAIFLILLGMILYRYFGNRETLWSRSYKEEKIGLSAHKLFKPNGYMVSKKHFKSNNNCNNFKNFRFILVLNSYSVQVVALNDLIP